MTGVDGVDPACPGSQQSLGEPAGGCPDVDGHATGDGHGERLKSGSELAGTPERCRWRGNSDR